MPWQSYAAPAAAAVLGYTWNNLPGAHRGFHIGRRMAPIPKGKKRKISRGGLGPKNAKKRRFKAPPFVHRKSVVSRGKRRRGRKRFKQPDQDAARSYFTIKMRRYRLRKGLRRAGAERHIVMNLAQRINMTTQNQTGWTTLPLSLTTASAVNTALFSQQDLLACFQNLETDQAVPAATTSALWTNATERFYLREINSTVTIKSESNSQITVWLYDVTFRRDWGTTIDPVVQFKGGIYSDETGDHVVAATATIQQKDPSGTNDLTTVPMQTGLTPYQSEQFCQIFKVRRVTKLILHPGSEHVHRINLKYNKMVNRELVANYTAFHGSTVCVLVGVQGPLTHSGTANTYEAGTYTAAIDCMVTTHYRFSQMEKCRTVHSQYQNMVAMTTPHIILEDTDADVAAANA